MNVYVHIPFCHGKCAYCDFYSMPLRETSTAEKFVEAIVAEWRSRTAGMEPFDIDTLYFGGGTPSMLPVTLLSRIVEALEVDTARLREATIEVNPEDVTPGYVRQLAALTPFRRVSMGVQSLQDHELRAVGRRHTSAQALEAYATLRDGGIENISLDLIYGLPGQTLSSWEDSLVRTLALAPDHLSAYLLSYEPNTPLTIRRDKGIVHEASDDLAEDMYWRLCAATAEHGYRHYEISNFAIPGREAVHNSGYWDSTPYIGLGPGAHSFIGGVRSANPSSLKAYLAAGGVDFNSPEEAVATDRYNDIVITRLRTDKGIRMEELLPDEAALFRRNAAPLVRAGALREVAEGHYIIPEEHWLTADAILVDLIQ